MPTASPQSVPTFTGNYPTIGVLINGKYLVEKLIGEGGVGIVVAAQNVELGDRVALKFLRKDLLERPDVVDRFVFEARAACSIKSDHSASVFDVGRTAEGVPFLVMEFLEGRDLASIIAETGSLEVRDATEYGMHACEALAVAHAKGIVHRDIKPENLFVEVRNGMRSVKVLDFGISKTALTGSALSSIVPLASAQSIMGTPLYMSPEQVRSPEKVDPRTDIWSLGVVLYEALTGTLPFVHESITELCAAIVDNPITPIAKYRNDLPDDLVQVIEKCLAKDMDDRYQNVAEVALALLPFAPKRARICAERAGEVLVAAGIAEPSSVRFASSYPSAMSTGSIPVVQSLVIAPPGSIPSGLFRPNGAITLAGESIEALPPPKRRGKLIVGAALATLALAGGVLVLGGRMGGEGRPASSAPPPPTQTVPPPAPAELPAPVASASASTSVAEPVPPPVLSAAPRVKAKPAVSTAEPKVDSLDIGY